MLASGGLDNVVKLWDSDSGKLIATLASTCRVVVIAMKQLALGCGRPNARLSPLAVRGIDYRSSGARMADAIDRKST
ncbi:hypothetical protein [Novipirellula sp.]|uniref:hypothetical protein n=1 Tax=Novipirellula sp. TaxID=2795430 RepID=UPI0035627C2B